MFKKILLLAALPALLFAQPAEARRLFWWQMVNPDGTDVSPSIYDDSVAPQDVYGQDPYAQHDEQFNQDQYQLYRREMARRYHRNAYVDPYAAPIYADPTPPPPYAAPVYPVKPTHKVIKKVVHVKSLVKKPVATTTATIAPQAAPATSAPVTDAAATPTLPPAPVTDAAATPSLPPAPVIDAAATPTLPPAPVTDASATPTPPPITTASTTVARPKSVPVKKSGTVTCEKGATIVSSFGFEGVSTKSCDGGTLVYNANRGGKPFEINVSASSGELTAVKKL
ncbi:MAG: hypothetical protein ABJA10_10045 [Aestuariivirga sp.]